MEIFFLENGDCKKKKNGLNNNALVDLPRVRGPRSRHDALETRNELRDFLNSEEGSLPWQLQYIRRTSHYAV